MSIAFKHIDSLYQEHVDKIYRFFYYRTLSKHEAEDLTSETFLQFTTSITRGKIVSQPTAYLYGVAKNVFIAFLQRKYKDQSFTVDATFLENIPFQEYIEAEDRKWESEQTLEDRAQAYIHHLPEKQRFVVEMRLIQKLTPKEIGEQLNKDRNYVKTTLKRVLKRALLASNDCSVIFPIIRPLVYM